MHTPASPCNTSMTTACTESRSESGWACRLDRDDQPHLDDCYGERQHKCSEGQCITRPRVTNDCSRRNLANSGPAQRWTAPLANPDVARGGRVLAYLGRLAVGF